MTRQRETELWALSGLYFDTWSPGDGVTRYRFSLDPEATYFSSEGIYTALGWHDAQVFGFEWAKARRAKRRHGR